MKEFYQINVTLLLHYLFVSDASSANLHDVYSGLLTRWELGVCLMKEHCLIIDYLCTIFSNSGLLVLLLVKARSHSYSRC